MQGEIACRSDRIREKNHKGQEMTTHSGVSYKPLDVAYDVIAPENILFRYVIAGPFLRIWAWLWDVAIIHLWLILSNVGASLLFIQMTRALDGKWEDVLFAIFWTFVIANIFFSIWFWNATCEALFSGRTFGKMICGLRTVTISEGAISVEQAFLRNILRAADWALVPFIVVVMGKTDRMARLGDLVAGTIVVNERVMKEKKRSISFKEEKVLTIVSYIPDEFVVSESLRGALAVYLARRLDTAPARRYELAAPLAGALARKMNFSYQVDPDAFLCALWQKTLSNS